ncbi:MAG: hypothetical protein ACI84O_000539 [Myxococcota bacterium]|jgi:hypothetical protein
MNRFALTMLAVAAISIAGCGSEDEDTAAAFNACSNTNDILNLPFSYSLAESNRALAPGYIDDTEGTYVHFAPFGAHFQPMTELAYGNGKTTFAGFFSDSNADIDEIPISGSGVFGWYAGATPAEYLHARRPMYYSPSAATITSISYDGLTLGLYLDDEPTWTIALSFGDIKMKLEHVGKFSPILHDFIADPNGTLNIDTDTYSGPIGDIFPNGYLISAPSGIELAYPQVVASAVPGSPGYYNGAGSEFPDRPHVKMQFSVTAPTTDGNTEVCALELLSTSLQSSFQNMLDNDILDANSQRFAGWQDTAWQWRAESSACLSCSTLTNSLNGLYKDLGGWFERGDNSTVRDELVAFIPVQQNTASYDATLYVHDVQTEWLITRRKNNSLTFDWTMEDTSIVSTDNPTGEIIAVEADALLVLWRDLGVATNKDAYQWVRYDITGGIVTLKFGDFSDLEVNALKPNFDLVVDIANDNDVITFGKTKIAGF